MKNAKWVTALAVVFAITVLNAQQKEWCGSMPALREVIAADPVFAAKYDAFKEILKNEEAKSKSRAVTDDFPVVFVPVVFHIVHNGDPVGFNENISDAQVRSQIDILNRDYNHGNEPLPGVPAAFQNLAANCKVKFCLAQTDPQGNPTSGILRHPYLSFQTWDSQRIIDSVLKPATIWDPNVFLNIWSVNMGGSLLQQGLLGYAYIPPMIPPDADGVVARYNAIGNTGNLLPGYQTGKTVSHEVGHWLGLFHTWGDDNGLCMTNGGGSDYIDDTPDEANANFGCPDFPHISCDNGPNGDLYVDFMDYTDDNCGGLFTPDQAARMHFVLDGYRSSIKIALTSCFYDLDADIYQLIVPGDTVCSRTFTPAIDFRNIGVITLQSGKFYYQVDSGTVQIYNWNGPLLTGNATRVFLPEQNLAAGKHNFNVTFVPDGIAADNNNFNNSKAINFYVYDGGAGKTLPFSENFENLFPGTNWEVDNPNNDAETWMQNPYVGAYGKSDNSVSIDNLAYGSNPGRKRDGLITTSYDYTSITFPELSFDIAYARYNSTRSDSLNIYSSLDCGSTWTRFWGHSGKDLATAPDQTTPFVPLDIQWKTITVPLWNLIGLEKAELKFENVTGWGNAMYLDNINVHSNPNMVAVKEIAQDEVKVFPNPASDAIGVRLPYGHTYKILQMINMVGQVVHEEKIADYSTIIRVDNQPPGLYLLQLTGDNKTQVEKIMVSH